MKAEYKPIQQQADRLRYRLQDMVDDGNSDTGKRLIKLSRDVMECVESDKPPRAIETRILELKRYLEDVDAEDAAAMSVRDASTMADEYEDLRREVRQLPHY